MFAVPGWSVSARNLKIERESQATTNKKRKRSSPENLPLDTKEIGDLWKKHVEAHDGNNEQDNNEQDGTAESQVLSKKKQKLKRSSSAANEDLENTAQDTKHKKTKHEDSVNHIKKLSKPAIEKASTEKKRPVASTSSRKDEQTKKQQQQSKDKNASARHNHADDLPETPVTTNSASSISAKTPPKLTPLQASMRQKLISSRFRYLNETLYTTPSASSLELFKTNPEFFNEYHEGFRRQVEAWPENPVDSFLRWIDERGPIGMRNHKKNRQKTNNTQGEGPQTDAELLSSEKEPLPRDMRRWTCNIADLGCGDGKLGLELTNTGLSKKLRLKVHSFDLVSAAPHIQVADIRSLPLEDSSMDVAIFCLALMGTNWVEFIEEAYRILRWKGECWIAEVTSRFTLPKASRVEHSVGNKVKNKQKKGGKLENRHTKAEEEPEELGMADDAQSQPQSKIDVSAFAAVLRRRGFVLQDVPQTGNKMFVLMRFVKALSPRKGKNVKPERMEGKKKFLPEDDEDISIEDEAKILKPCVYKLR